ncbi:unnamed protein product [Pleuronectes platessa]|uniref:Uncharacterized protein n=1 Tax=Pleuronectes platessa TaxID=8262 RepID=A0A9N7Y4J7_PLEPL|nr:unnamed protein product [Pleuronectes platessa]
MLNWGENQNSLEELHIPSDLGTTRNPPGRAGNHVYREMADEWWGKEKKAIQVGLVEKSSHQLFLQQFIDMTLTLTPSWKWSCCCGGGGEEEEEEEEEEDEEEMSM